MTVSITLIQKNTTKNDASGVPEYTSDNEVTASIGIPLQLFVFKVSDDSFSHVAMVFDLEEFPADKAQAESDGKAFYRKATAVRSFALISEALSFATHVDSRLQFLANDFPVAKDQFLGDSTTTFVTKT
jgi:hypothetical protein